MVLTCDVAQFGMFLEQVIVDIVLTPFRNKIPVIILPKPHLDGGNGDGSGAL